MADPDDLALDATFLAEELRELPNPTGGFAVSRIHDALNRSSDEHIDGDRGCVMLPTGMLDRADADKPL